MPRTHNLLRRTCRRRTTRAWRALGRRTLRSLPGCRRGPDDLSQALTAFGRVVRAHRRLARLAPRFFDSVVVERERRESEARRLWMAEWEPALARVYGGEPQPYDPSADRPPLPPPRIQQAVECELASWNFWLAAGRLALEKHQHRNPHALLSFSRIARLLELGFKFGSLATGYDPARPQPEPVSHDTARADLERAYGDSRPSSADDLPVAAGAPEAPAPPAPASLLSASSSELIKPAASEHSSSTTQESAPPAIPSHVEPKRCDTWSRWARQLRRLKGTS